MSYGENIKRLRRAANLNQAELGEMLHVSNRTISSWEQGRTEPNMDMVNALCEALKCKHSELMAGITTANNIELSRVEHELILAYRQANDGIKSSVLKLLDIDVKKDEGILSA